MMQYSILLNIDDNNEPTGLFTFLTTEGDIIILFSNSIKRDAFLEAISKSGVRKIGFVNIESESAMELAQKLLDMDVSLTGQVNFLPDSDPLCDELLTSIRDRALHS